MEIVERLREELSRLVDAIHGAGGGVVFEEFPGALGEDADGANAPSKARRALIHEVNELAEMLAQSRREGDGIAMDKVVGGFRRERAELVIGRDHRAD
jgi:hypothetical protein